MDMTPKQQELLAIIQRRASLRLPTVQQDLADAMGIRRDSLNKLLHRLRLCLDSKGESLPVLSRRSEHRVDLLSLGQLGGH